MKRLLVVVALAAGCGNDAPKPPAGSAAPTHHDAAPVVAISLDAPVSGVAAVAHPTVEALWDAYQAAHVPATRANVIETGRAMWPLLGDDAHEMVTTAVAATIDAMDTRVRMTTQDVAYKILGEGAAARRDLMLGARLAEVTPDGPREIGGVVIETSRLVVRGSGGETFELVAVRAGADGTWTLAASPSLLITEDEMFRTPSGGQAPAGVASLDAVAARWTEILARGTGWDAYNLMSPSTRAQMNDMLVRVGGSGAGDVARVLEKTVADRRDRGISVVTTTIEDRTADRGTIVLTYSNGRSDRFVGVRVDGVWWLEMPL